jgi:hypothetical protein
MSPSLAGLFSSEAACNSVARRAIRARSRDVLSVAQYILPSLIPMARRMVSGRKILRGELRPMVFRIAQALRMHENVVDLHYETVVPPPSADEMFVLTYVQAVAAKGDERSLDFVTVKLLFTRNYVTIRHAETEFSVTDHVLSRYMQREKKDVTTFYQDIMRPMRTAYVVGPNAVIDRELALPFASGLLIGTARVVKDETPAGFECRIGTDGPGALEPVADAPFADGHRVVFDMRTYVSNNDLFDDKAKVLRRLKEFEATHAEQIKLAFNILAFGGNRQMLKHVGDAYADAVKIVQSPEWREMVSHRIAAGGK